MWISVGITRQPFLTDGPIGFDWNRRRYAVLKAAGEEVIYMRHEKIDDYAKDGGREVV